MTKEYPKCRICGVELGEGYSLKRVRGNPLYLCVGCFDLISAVAHDGAVSVFEDMTEIMRGPVKPAATWKQKLEAVEFPEGDAK